MNKTIVQTLLFVLMLVSFANAENVIVIVNKNVSATTLSRDEIQQVFLGKKTAWPDGKKITPVIHKGGNVQEVFLKDYMNKTSSQYEAFWKQAIFTGTGKPLKSLSGDEDIVQFVSRTDGAVGYIDADSPHRDVKRLDVK